MIQNLFSNLRVYFSLSSSRVYNRERDFFFVVEVNSVMYILVRNIYIIQQQEQQHQEKEPCWQCQLNNYRDVDVIYIG